jgi:xylulokinase
MEYILTIDAGTSAFKIMLWNERGSPVANYTEELSLHTPQPGFAEFPVDEYWHVTRRGIRNTLRASHVDPRRVRVAVISSQGETLINLDRHAAPLRNAIVWIDNRSVAEAAQIERTFGRTTVFRITGQPEIAPTWPATKILWQNKHEPEVFGQTAKFLMVEDYLLHKLTGEIVGEYSVHSSSLWLDIKQRQLWREMLDFLDVKPEQFPELRDSGEIVGHLTADAARQTGLSEDTLVVTGSLDQAAGAIGAGNVKPGICSETTGSALAVCVLAPQPITNPKFGIPCHCHALKDTYYLMAWSQTAGLALKWFKDTFCESQTAEAWKKRCDVYGLLEREARKVAPGSESLIFLPHLTGVAFPDFNPHVRGVFFGISLNHRRPHFVRAIMESVAFMLKENTDVLERMAVDVSEIRAGGGGSKSRLWNQIKADVLGKPVRCVLTSEAASAGVAILAGMSVGIFAGLDDGCKRIARLGQRIMPTGRNEGIYRECFRKYTALYKRLQPLFSPPGCDRRK